MNETIIDISAIIGFIGALIFGLYWVYFIFHNRLFEHYITCIYCGKKTYLGIDHNKQFERDHLRTYRCRYCNANLFEGAEKA
jgi:hypothetical protein